METVVKVGKRNAIYMPKGVMESLGIGEGSSLLLVVREGRIELVPLRRPDRFWAEVTAEEVEMVGEGISRDLGLAG